MANDYKAMAQNVLDLVGGTDNLSEVTHCATRLRLSVKDPQKVDVEALKKVKNVLAVELRGNYLQVIVGQIVEDLYFAVLEITGDKLGGGAVPDDTTAPDEKKKPLDYVTGFLLMVAGIMSPVIPALVCTGFLSTILTVMSVFFGIDSTNSTYAILYNFSQAALYFLPVFVAYGAAKKFETERILAMLLACALLYPNWVDMVNTLTAEGQTFTSYFGLPVMLTTYNGAVIQIILSVWIMSKIDKLFKRIIPEVCATSSSPSCSSSSCP